MGFGPASFLELGVDEAEQQDADSLFLLGLGISDNRKTEGSGSATSNLKETTLYLYSWLMTAMQGMIQRLFNSDPLRKCHLSWREEKKKQNSSKHLRLEVLP